VARSGAGIVICPSTEGNLGDGYADLPGWLAAGVPMALGSDSHVGRQWNEEIRWLEYGQRLRLQQRNVAAAPGHQPATAARLLEAAVHAGAAASGHANWSLQVGARADAWCWMYRPPAYWACRARTCWTLWYLLRTHRPSGMSMWQAST